jgi:hypothetical protein
MEHSNVLPANASNSITNGIVENRLDVKKQKTAGKSKSVANKSVASKTATWRVMHKNSSERENARLPLGSVLIFDDGVAKVYEPTGANGNQLDESQAFLLCLPGVVSSLLVFKSAYYSPHLRASVAGSLLNTDNVDYLTAAAATYVRGRRSTDVSSDHSNNDMNGVDWLGGDCRGCELAPHVHKSKHHRQPTKKRRSTKLGAKVTQAKSRHQTTKQKKPKSKGTTCKTPALATNNDHTGSSSSEDEDKDEDEDEDEDKDDDATTTVLSGEESEESTENSQTHQTGSDSNDGLASDAEQHSDQSEAEDLEHVGSVSDDDDDDDDTNDACNSDEEEEDNNVEQESMLDEAEDVEDDDDDDNNDENEDEEDDGNEYRSSFSAGRKSKVK